VFTEANDVMQYYREVTETKLSVVQLSSHTMSDEGLRAYIDKTKFSDNQKELIGQAISNGWPIKIQGIFEDHLEPYCAAHGIDILRIEKRFPRRAKQFNWHRPIVANIRNRNAGEGNTELWIVTFPSYEYVEQIAELTLAYILLRQEENLSDKFGINREAQSGLIGTVSALHYPNCEQSLKEWSGLQKSLGKYLMEDDVVVIGCVTEIADKLHEYLRKPKYKNWQKFGASDMYELQVYLLDDGRRVVLLGDTHCFWGSAAGYICRALAESGARQVVYIGKLGTLIGPDKIHTLCCPSHYYLLDKTPAGSRWKFQQHKVASTLRDNFLELTKDFITGIHLTVPTVVGETLAQSKEYRQLRPSTIDNEIGYIARELEEYNKSVEKYNHVEFTCLHFITDYLRVADNVDASAKCGLSDVSGSTRGDMVLQAMEQAFWRAAQIVASFSRHLGAREKSFGSPSLWEESVSQLAVNGEAIYISERETLNRLSLSDAKRIYEIASLGEPIDAKSFQWRPALASRIHEWFSKPLPRGYTLYGVPGQGKTEFARHFALACYQNAGLHVLGVSLKSGKSSETLIAELAALIPGSDSSLLTEQINKIVGFYSTNDALLIIDEVEHQQKGLGGAWTGVASILPGPLQELLISLLSFASRARILLLSRADVRGIDGYGRVCSEELPPLTSEEGRNLLHSLGMTETDEVLEDISKALRGHPQSLCLVPSVLNRRKVLYLLGIAKELSKEQFLQEMLAWYKASLSPEALSLLRVVAACDRPMSASAMSLILSKQIADPLRPRVLEKAKSECRSVMWETNGQGLDIHPVMRQMLQREWFESRRQKAVAAHNVLAEFYVRQATAAVERGNPSLLDLEPAFAAMHHYITLAKSFPPFAVERTRAFHQALRIYTDLLYQNPTGYLVNRLSAWEASRNACLMFLGDWDPLNNPLPLSIWNVSALIGNLSNALRHLGRLDEALHWAELESQERGKAHGDILSRLGPGIWNADTMLQIYNQLQKSDVRSTLKADLGLLNEAKDHADQALDVALYLNFDLAKAYISKEDSKLVDERSNFVNSAMMGGYELRGKIRLFTGQFDLALEDFETALRFGAAVDGRTELGGEYMRHHLSTLLLVDRGRNLNRAWTMYRSNLDLVERDFVPDKILENRIEACMLARLEGDRPGAMQNLNKAYESKKLTQDRPLHITLELETARFFIQFGTILRSTEHAQHAFDLAIRGGFQLLAGDALALLAEAEPIKDKRDDYVRRLAEIVDGYGYGRRRRDLDLLRNGGQPVIELGL
jgi:tetratricopeptide (TPR) repeat protein